MEETTQGDGGTLDSQQAIRTPETIDHALMARMHIREGKSFAQSALSAGYSESIANKGLRHLMAVSTPCAEAIRKEWESISVDIGRLKPIAVGRLYREIAAPDAPYAMKAIEIAGKFKETDWFVRNTDNQVGILINMTDQSPTTTDIEHYKE